MIEEEKSVLIRGPMSSRDAQFEKDEMAHLTGLYPSLDQSVIVAAYGRFKSMPTEKAWTALLAGESNGRDSICLL